jgi:hypothetical protein
MHVAMRDRILVWLDGERTHARELLGRSVLGCNICAEYMIDIRGSKEMLSQSTRVWPT